MTGKANFKKAVGAALKSARFAAKGQSWYLDGKDSIVVLNLQKSDFDDKYYVNFGVWLRLLGAVDLPPVNQCHIQTRLTSLFPADAELIDRACRMDAADADLTQFIELLRGSVVPFCDDCLQISFLRSLYERGEFKKALVMKNAKDVLHDAPKLS